MAKSKFAKANEAIAKNVTGAFGAVEDAVVGGYKAVETAVTGGYGKIEDAFVDRYLTKDGESVEEAKARLRSETH